MTYVTLHPHDPVWFDRFEREREHIGATVRDMLDVFHIGSTAIPGLPSKTTLDAVAVFEDAETMATARDALYDDGFGPHRDDPDWIVVARSGGEYDVCLHLRPRKHDTWCGQIVFREYLRENVEHGRGTSESSGRPQRPIRTMSMPTSTRKNRASCRS